MLTVLLRVALLPFTILTERGKVISQRLRKEIREIKKDFANDPIKQKQMIRDLLRRKKIRPWAKAVVLGVQGLILLLLYKVFIGGINSQANFQHLYPSIPRPDFVNTKFLGFDIAQQNLLLCAITAGYVFAQLMLGVWQSKKKTTRNEQLFIIFFPAFVFLILAFLPSAKALFVLTSLVFSSIISMITALIKQGVKKNNTTNAQPPVNVGPQQ